MFAIRPAEAGTIDFDEDTPAGLGVVLVATGRWRLAGATDARLSAHASRA